MSKDKPITTQQAFDIGKRGGTVDTNGMSAADRNRIDKAVNDGKASNTKK
jgi:hypothetical protein